ncbi:hypothetical protein ACFPMF_10435 [Larkinella bovis]|uniref:Lipoprotein n=1 Tax=Larkinella bovis TaxID=683041 RepID=A0ABW0IBJ7_9BACT
MKKIVLALVTLFAVFGCKDQEEVQPQNRGNYLIYTNLNGSKFDQVEIRLDGKTVGMLSESLGNADSPSCDTKSSALVLNISRPAGSYSFDAIATLKGKKVTSWATSLRFADGECQKRRLTSDL